MSLVVTLIGYRGSGKSTVARALAERWGWTSCDADDEIERLADRSIREIFADEGEAGFRQREHDCLADLLQRTKIVLASGGGAILNAATRQRMQAAGPVVWLTADVDTLAARIAGDVSTADRRPQLTNQSAGTEVAAVLAERIPLYEATSDFAIDVANRTIPEICDCIGAQLDATVAEGTARS